MCDSTAWCIQPTASFCCIDSLSPLPPPPPSYSYKGHKNSDYKLDSCLSHDDAHVVSGSEDGRVCFWDLVEVSLSICLYCLPASLSVCLSVCLSVGLSPSVSVCLCLHVLLVSLTLSLFLCVSTLFYPSLCKT